jgi:transposase
MAALPLLTTQSEELHQPIRPQPQRPPPPSKTKPAVAGPAELVTCDQTIEHTINRLKQWRRVATRDDKREANYLAMDELAAALIWL